MLGQRLKQARIEAGLSQRQLCGEEITRNMLSQIESGKAKPSMQTLTYLAQKLGKSISWFLEEEAAPSPNQQVMETARQQYSQNQYTAVLEALKNYREQGDLSDGEAWLLRALSLLGAARQALDDNKVVYARSLLEKAEQAGRHTDYFTPAMERERLLLMYQADPSLAKTLAGRLPADDRELFLRARAYLDTGAYEDTQVTLSAVREKNGLYHYLSGQALMGQNRYDSAVEHFLQAEGEYPLLCAKALETCYRELEDYKMAYHYACKQRL